MVIEESLIIGQLSDKSGPIPGKSTLNMPPLDEGDVTRIVETSAKINACIVS